MQAPIGNTNVLTTIHFVLIAILITLTVAGILWGMKLKRERAAAEKVSKERVEEAEAEPPASVEAAPPPPAIPAAPPPVVETPVKPPEPEPEPVRAPDPLDDEPVAAAAPQDASPASEAAVQAPAATPAPDPAAANAPVTTLKGVGPKVAAMLAEQGVTTVGQLAALDAGEAEAIDARLGAFTGRMARDRWIEQARFLAAGDRAGFEAVFGRL